MKNYRALKAIQSLITMQTVPMGMRTPAGEMPYAIEAIVPLMPPQKKFRRLSCRATERKYVVGIMQCEVWHPEGFERSRGCASDSCNDSEFFRSWGFSTCITALRSSNLSEHALS